MNKKMSYDNSSPLPNTSILGNVDSPYQMQILDSDDILCKGWYYSNDGIKSIEIYIDTNKIGDAVQCGNSFKYQIHFLSI